MGLMWPTNDHERIVQRQQEALFHGDLEAYCRPLTEDVIFADPAAPGVLRGAAEIKPFLRRVLARFDDCESFGFTRRKFYTYPADERDPQTRVAMVFTLSYRTQDDELVHVEGVDVFEFRGSQISRLTSYYHPPQAAGQT